MKLSTKGRYATRAMLYLSRHYGEGPVQVKDISNDQHISSRYLEQLMITLKTAGLVRVVRGAHGGFTLSRPPSEINLMEIYSAVEGSIAPVECVDDSESCERSSSCVTREIWMEMKQAMNGVLKSVTLQELAERQAKKEAVSYYI